MLPASCHFVGARMYDVLFLLAVLGIARLSGAATYKLTTRSTTYALSGAVPLIPGLSYQSTTYAVRYTTDVLGALNVEQRNGWAVSCTIDIAKACRVRPDRLVCATYLWDPPDSAIVFFDLLPTATGNATDVAKVCCASPGSARVVALTGVPPSGSSQRPCKRRYD